MAIAAVDEAGKAPSRYALEYVAVYVYRFNDECAHLIWPRLGP